ncbi:MFS transporter [Pseudomonas sp. VD9]|uniref:MFS transporter n=1 Tax=Pseudomonas sp. VD9 TaxID=3342076 RepID=UPI003C6C1F07
MNSLLSLFHAAPARPLVADPDGRRFRRVRWLTFLSMSLSYALFYVCRLSFNVAKPALVGQNLLSPTQLGMIGSALFFTYAVGKLVNGFLADHANVRRFMMLGLLISAVVNACMGLTTNAIILTLAWGLNGWAQSMGVGPCVVSLSRWYADKERGTFYGFWSIAHSLGEALTYIAVAAVIVTWGWQYGYFLATAMGVLGMLLIYLFMADSPQSAGFAEVDGGREEVLLKTVGKWGAQLALLKNPALWLLALASCLMYIGRYAVISWGVFFLENAKGYNTLSASALISITGVFGIVGTGLSGLVSDRFFDGRRHGLAILFGLMNSASLGMFLFLPPLLAGCAGHDVVRPFHGRVAVFSRRLDGRGHCRQKRSRCSAGHDRHCQLRRGSGGRDSHRGVDRTRHHPGPGRQQAVRLPYPVAVLAGRFADFGIDDRAVFRASSPP